MSRVEDATAPARPAAVLFDLDGTLVDSAPDLAGAANDLRARRGLPPCPYVLLRPHAGSGARGMLAAAFAIKPGDDAYAAMREEFLAHYATRLLQLTRPFDGVLPLLDALRHAGLPVGIVTNKALALAQALVQGLGLATRVEVLIGGDSTAHTKPHPAPLRAACEALRAVPTRCVYIGDDPRDMQAAHAAGMPGWAAAWGYLGPDKPIAHWGAERVITSPSALLKTLQLA